MFHSERSFKDFVMGILIGGSLGTLFLNTKRGKKIQKELMHKYHKVSRAAEDFIKDQKTKIKALAKTKKSTKKKRKAK